MEKRNIPNTNWKVTPICLVTMTFGAPVDKTAAAKLVHYALDHGVNFIDTANMYEGYNRVPGSAGGVAEKILGKALEGKREQVILATKVGMKVGDAPEDEGTSPGAIRKQLEKSLSRLATDYIDIYYLHRPDTKTPIAETIATLDQVICEGKVRYYGVSNCSVKYLDELLVTADINGLPRPVICQPPLSLLRQEAISGLLPLCKKENIAVAPYQVLQGGLLTGKYRRGEPMPMDSRKAEKSDWVWDLTDELYDKLEEIEVQAHKKGITMTQYAIRWVLSQPSVVAAIIGVKRIEQLEEAIAAVIEI